MTLYESVPVLSAGSLVRLSNPDGEQEAAFDVAVRCVSSKFVVVDFGEWYKIWNRDELEHDAREGVWRASKPS
jgi:hypothetical protein